MESPQMRAATERMHEAGDLVAQHLDMGLAHLHGRQANAVGLCRTCQVHPHPGVGQGRSLAAGRDHRARGLVVQHLDLAVAIHLRTGAVLVPAQASQHGLLSARANGRHGHRKTQQPQRDRFMRLRLARCVHSEPLER